MAALDRPMASQITASHGGSELKQSATEIARTWCCKSGLAKMHAVFSLYLNGGPCGRVRTCALLVAAMELTTWHGSPMTAQWGQAGGGIGATHLLRTVASQALGLLVHREKCLCSNTSWYRKWGLKSLGSCMYAQRIQNLCVPLQLPAHRDMRCQSSPHALSQLQSSLSTVKNACDHLFPAHSS